MNNVRHIFLLIITMVCFLSAGAQTEVTDSLQFRFHFKQGGASLDVHFRDNNTQLNSLTDSISKIISEGHERRIIAINVEGSASPEGSDAVNNSLALRRARSIRSYIIDATGIDPSLVKAYSVGIDWMHLASLLRQSSLPGSGNIAGIITDNIDCSNAAIVRKIKALDGGRSWRLMMQSLFPEMRQGSASVTCYVSSPQRRAEAVERIVTVRDTVTVHSCDTVYVHSHNAAPTPMVEAVDTLPYRKKMILAVRTNLLMPLLNVGVEVPVGNRWSVGADWYWPWLWRQWHSSSEMKHCQELLFGGADVRYWFGKRHTEGADNWQYRLSGHSVGAYGYGGYYDFGKDYDGRQGSFFDIGFDYLYSMRLGKRKSLRLEFSLGIGWIRSRLQKYAVYSEGGHAYRTGGVRTVNWFGPTKATVSLVIPINKKIRKEDAR